MIEYQDAKRIAQVLAAVGEPTRIAILSHLVTGPSHVGRLADLVGVPMVNISHHLGVLRQAGLVEDAKDGRRVVYSFRPDVFTAGGNGGDTIGTLQLPSFRLHLVKDGGLAANPDKGKPAAAAKPAAKAAKPAPEPEPEPDEAEPEPPKPAKKSRKSAGSGG